MKKLKKVMAMFLALTMVMSMVFVGGARDLSYAATDDSTITLPLTLHDAHQDGLIFQRLGNNTGFCAVNDGDRVSHKGLLEDTLDNDNKIVYNNKSIEYLANLMQSDLTKTWASGSINQTLINVLKKQIQNNNNGEIVIGTAPSEQVTDFYSIKTCCDAVSWMTYYMFRDGGVFYYNTETYEPVAPKTSGDNIAKYEYTKSDSTYNNLVLKQQSDGSYSFTATKAGAEKVIYSKEDKYIMNDPTGESSLGLFPLNYLGFGNSECSSNSKKNYGYTLESSGKFVYHQAEKLYFDFTGDDDVYLFINKKLALDIGGAHTAVNDKIYLEDNCTIDGYTDETWAQYLGLEEGGIYDFNFFYMERHTTESDMGIKTNIRVYDAAAVPQKNAYVQNTNGEYKQIPYGGLIAAGKNITYEFVLSNTADLKIENLTFRDDKLGVSLDKDNIILNSTTSPEDIDITIVDKDGNSKTENNTSDNSVLKSKLASGLNPGETIKIRGFKHILNKEEVDKDTSGYLNTMKYTAIAENGVFLTDTASSLVRPISFSDKAFVIDYGKPVTYEYSQIFDARDQSDNYGTVTFNGSTAQSVTGAYGTMTNNSDNKNVTYKLNKFMNGIDEFNFNQKITSTDENGIEIDQDLPTNVSMIPANSVYYEDDFASTETIAQGEDESKVRIVYSGEWATDGKAQNTEKQDTTNKQYGWDSSYKDDKEYSNGTAHKTSAIGAKAKFTFTGTGVDVYSRTDLQAGEIFATLKKDGQEVIHKFAIVNNRSAHDGTSSVYYQIPTLFFNKLTYGTYTVEIEVLSDATDETKTSGTYYLDGIRVYNPLGNAEGDPVSNDVSKNAYIEAGEYNAVFTTVRDILLEKGLTDSTATEANGIVYIDEAENKQTGQTTNEISVYEKYGPKNEVYLDKGQSIAFKINSSYNKVFIGAKAPKGGTAKMKVTNAKGDSDIAVTDNQTKTITVDHASDMYYEIVPTNDNYVVIKNEGSSLLAITKLRLTGVSSAVISSNEIDVSYEPQLMSYVNTFSTLKSSATDESGMVVENSGGDVDVDNPTDNQEHNQNKFRIILQKIFDSLKKWFGR